MWLFYHKSALVTPRVLKLDRDDDKIALLLDNNRAA